MTFPWKLFISQRGEQGQAPRSWRVSGGLGLRVSGGGHGVSGLPSQPRRNRVPALFGESCAAAQHSKKSRLDLDFVHLRGIAERIGQLDWVARRWRRNIRPGGPAPQSSCAGKNCVGEPYDRGECKKKLSAGRRWEPNLRRRWKIHREVGGAAHQAAARVRDANTVITNLRHPGIIQRQCAGGLTV